MTKTFFLVSDTSEREREREKERKTKFETHYSFGYTKHKGNIIVPERVIGKHQNNPEKRPVFHHERRNEEGEEHGERRRPSLERVRRPSPLCGGGGGGGLVVETRRLSVFLSLASLLCARKYADFMQRQNLTYFYLNPK